MVVPHTGQLQHEVRTLDKRGELGRQAGEMRHETRDGNREHQFGRKQAAAGPEAEGSGSAREGQG